MSYNSYRDSSTFLRAVESKDVFFIKSELEGIIFMLDGDKKKCEEAVEYARNNSDFDWEEDDGETLTEGSIRDKYNYEKGKLFENFSKERFERVIRLYKELYPPKNNIKLVKKKTVWEEIKERKKELSIAIVVVIVIGIIIAVV